MIMRRSPRNVKISCNHAGLSHFAGTYFFQEFLRVLHFRYFLAEQIRYPRRNRDYSVSQMLLALVYPIVLGLDRIETAALLRSDGTFQYLTGLQSFPDPQTLRRFLLNAPTHLREQLHRTNDRLLQRFIHMPEQRSRLIFDLDSTVLTRMTPPLKRELKGLRYEPMNPRWEIADFEHRPHDWPHARRCIVARRKIEEAEPQPTLFTLERYAYRAWHTTLPLRPAGVWQFYDGRAGMERRIREIREDFALPKIPTRTFAANALYLEVIRLAYNLVTAFQRTCLPPEWQSLTLGKLRHRLFWLPGELTRPQNRPTLRLANLPVIRDWAEKILHRVHKLKPLER